LHVPADGIGQLAGDNAAVFREAGADFAERREYSRSNQRLTVTLYRMHDSTSAYGAYTFLLDDQMSPSDLTPHAGLSRRRAVLLTGNLLAEIVGEDLRPLRSLLKAIAARLRQAADTSPFPSLVEYFPAAGRISNSERYLLGPAAAGRVFPATHGDWLGFNLGAEAQVARYRINGQSATLILVSYPTPQVASHQIPVIARAFAADPTQTSSPDQLPIHFRRSSSLVAVVFDTHSQGVADSLLAKIQYQAQLTWNEPRQSYTDPTWGQVIVGTFVGTGIIMLFAVIAGIGFGGFRLLIKFFFPGKVFDRPQELDILQLGLSSKPIQAKDFY
jgi:hypothetical protein